MGLGHVRLPLCFPLNVFRGENKTNGQCRNLVRFLYFRFIFGFNYGTCTNPCIAFIFALWHILVKYRFFSSIMFGSFLLFSCITCTFRCFSQCGAILVAFHVCPFCRPSIFGFRSHLGFGSVRIMCRIGAGPFIFLTRTSRRYAVFLLKPASDNYTPFLPVCKSFLFFSRVYAGMMDCVVVIAIAEVSTNPESMSALPCSIVKRCAKQGFSQPYISLLDLTTYCQNTISEIGRNRTALTLLSCSSNIARVRGLG